MKFLTLLFLLFQSSWLLAQSPPQTSPKPNIILIMTDQQRWDTLSCLGFDHVLTPNIDRLAREGLRFDHGHVTIAVCQPSRSVMLTGRYPHRNGARGFEAIRDDIPTLSDELHKAGYVNGILGKVDQIENSKWT